MDWPAPYLQPDRSKDCGFYAAAYMARCLGHPETTAQQVMDWRAETSRHEAYHARYALGAEMRTMWDVFGSDLSRKEFWLGPGTQDWVRGWLADGWIAHLCVHRIAEGGHAAVLLEARDDGALLMDPIYGHITEPWSWLLGPGPKHNDGWPGAAEDGRPFYGCTYVEGWYRAPEGACGFP